ncbi:tubulin-like doman-containing protein [Niveispirillum cyanobacteriorum]|uniref:Uncharacterized protein n=1 Tax=Niveispirillum cyanobacteriorum TaxID=1612173 RepID=A0A2K9NHM4_9PROT|nr:tubulin-like doman-containing protein [Niveispirillum cyanobacteriorum]AUN32590.1 hypothetical protein C0V82_19855 [Niveispirillum cyanobacteriorum]GGE76926.1 hypothetical protein GCM10011317_37500 [Niveispirillum cyanobacteriorum]
MATDNNKRVITQHPTLLIGLGGTGKQVLLQLRRMFFDHYGVPTLGHIGHLWVDTDTRNRTLDGNALSWFYEQVNFQARESVMVELTKSDLRNYFSQQKSYPNIFSWLDPSLEKHGEISDGAAQIRMFGRLAFFKHYPRIRQALQTTLDDIRNSARHMETLRDHGIQVDASRTDAWLVMSVAGGTGSGMFLDMAFALKYLDPNITIRGIIVLPSVFTREYNHKIFGNSYAALMELEHYNYAKDTGEAAASHLFPVQWTLDQYQSRQTLRGPVFEMAYLVGNKPDSPAGELRVDQKTALCDMLAECLFVEYGGRSEAMAQDWASKRSNLQDSLANVVSLPYHGAIEGFTVTEEFSCRYGSIGLSKLHVPIQRVAALVRHRLAQDMVKHWVEPASVPSNFDSLIASDYHPRLMMREQAGGGRAGLFVRELGRGTGGASLEQLLRQSVERRREEFLRSAANPDIGSRLTEWLQTEMLRDQLDKTNPDRKKWGVLTRLILDQGLENMFSQISEELDRIVGAMVNSPGQRFTLTRELLRRLFVTLEAGRQVLVTQVQRTRLQSERRRQEIAKRLNWLNGIRGRFTRKTVVDVIIDLSADYLLQELRAQLCEAAIDLCGRLSDLIGRGTVTQDISGKEILVETGIVKQLSHLEQILIEDLAPMPGNHVDSLRQLPESPINISLLEENDLRDFYVTRDNKPLDAAALVDLSSRFFEETTDAGGGLWEMRELLQRDGSGKASELLLTFARRATPHLDERTVDAIDRFSRKYSADGQEYSSMLQRLLNNGMPWLNAPRHHVMEDKTLAHRKLNISLGICPTSPEVARRNFLKRMENNSTLSLPNVDNRPDCVYVASEMAGVPLAVTPELDRYRDLSYYTSLRNGLALHIDVDYEKFQDILVRNAEDAVRYIDALHLVGTAILANVIRMDRTQRTGGTQRMELFYIDRTSVMNDPINLGALKLALRRLQEAGSEGLRRNIQNDTDRRIRQMNDTERARWLALLRYHARHKSLGNSSIASVLERLAEQLERSDPDLVELARQQVERIGDWAVEQPSNSGIYCLAAR